MRLVLVALFSLALFVPQARAALTPEDQEILDRGPLPNGRYLASGIVGTVAGFGIGHAIQKRYTPLGLVFTLGEVAATTALLIDTTTQLTTTGSRETKLGSVAVAGLVVLVGLHAWEIVDIWLGGDHMRKRYDEVQSRAGKKADRADGIGAIPVAVAGDGMAPGLTLRLGL